MSWKLCSCVVDENGDATCDADQDCPDCDGRGVILVPEPIRDVIALQMGCGLSVTIVE